MEDIELKIKLLKAQLETLDPDVNCTHEQYTNVEADLIAAQICKWVDDEILRMLLNETGITDEGTLSLESLRKRPE